MRAADVEKIFSGDRLSRPDEQTEIDNEIRKLRRNFLSFLLQWSRSSISSKVCRENSNMPEYFAVLQEGGEAPKIVVCSKIVRKRDSNFFATAIGLRIEITDF